MNHRRGSARANFVYIILRQRRFDFPPKIRHDRCPPTVAMMFEKLVVLIPTRNRSDLAKLAIASVMGQLEGQPVHIVVSDNSTDQAQSAALDGYLAVTGGSAITLIRP